jgi:hypothetical protein
MMGTAETVRLSPYANRVLHVHDLTRIAVYRGALAR